jgi:hypothetical protein
MEYNTTYYWQIIAWDNHHAYTPGPQWEFTTELPPSNITVSIITPSENYFYFKDTPVFPLENRTIVYGAINIEVNATADEGIDRVEVYVDGNRIGTDEEPPYLFNWAPIISFKHTITAVAFDNEGNNQSDELEVFKWRFHPILLIAGSAILFKYRHAFYNLELVTGWTFFRGYIFNLKHRGNDLVFRAIRLHYTTIGPFGIDNGMIFLKKCRISDIGPEVHMDVGPLGSFSWIFGVCRGSFKGPYLSTSQ